MNTLYMANMFAVPNTGKPKRQPRKHLAKNRSWKRHRKTRWHEVWHQKQASWDKLAYNWYKLKIHH